MIAPYDITYPCTVSVTTMKSVVARFNIVFFIPENDDLQFSNTRHISGSRSIFEPLYGYFRRNRRREDHRGKNEDLKIEAKI